MKQKAQYSWNGMKDRVCGYVTVDKTLTPLHISGLPHRQEFDLAGLFGCVL